MRLAYVGSVLKLLYERGHIEENVHDHHRCSSWANSFLASLLWGEPKDACNCIFQKKYRQTFKQLHCIAYLLICFISRCVFLVLSIVICLALGNIRYIQNITLLATLATVEKTQWGREWNTLKHGCRLAVGKTVGRGTFKSSSHHKRLPLLISRCLSLWSGFVFLFGLCCV